MNPLVPRLMTLLDVAVEPPPADGGGLSVSILVLVGVVIAALVIAAVLLILRARSGKTGTWDVTK